MKPGQAVPPVFGLRLKRERERRDWSLHRVAAEAQTTASTVLRVERGCDLTLGTAIALAKAMGASLDELLAESPCGRCDGMPPEGFICSECGRKGETA
jgi:transcriptional regulator with XRE-family HTH domain